MSIIFHTRLLVSRVLPCYALCKKSRMSEYVVFMKLYATNTPMTYSSASAEIMKCAASGHFSVS